MYTYQNLNQALVGLSRLLLDEGYWTHRRDHRMLEMAHPVTMCITNPCDRYITVPGRKWNRFLPFVESLWMALGLNDLDALLGYYMKKAYTFSDDAHTWRGGYGPRIRAFSGIATDYYISDPRKRHYASGYVMATDQLRYVVSKLLEDPTTRQAVMQIGDPVKDNFNPAGTIKTTQDYPCSRTLQFIRSAHGELDCTLYIRSNDIYWGLSAVNVTNFTLMQEYVANMTGLPIGKYYHVMNNLHVYEDFVPKLEHFERFALADFPTHGIFYYKDVFPTIQDFDREINGLFAYEYLLRVGETEEEITFNYDLIDDWAKVFLKYHMPSKQLQFHNPYIQQLFDVPDAREKNTQYAGVQFPNQPLGLYPIYNGDVQRYRNSIKEANHYVIDVGKTDKHGRL